MIMIGDSLQQLATIPDASVHCCVTSPPYFGLRDYGMDGQIGLEVTPDAFVARLVEVFREVRRVLRDDGTLWVNLGDSYANPGHAKGNPGDGRSSFAKSEKASGHTHSKSWPGAKNKDLIGIPWRVAFALQADGYYLRQDIIWAKPNPMPESVTDRCTKSHEYIFLLSKSPRYYFDAEAIKEPAANAGKRVLLGSKSFSKGQAAGAGIEASGNGLAAHYDVKESRNKRDVWTVTTKPFKEAHFATFPPDLIEPCILAGCPVGGTVLDPFFGAGTTGLVAQNNGRKWIGIELNPEYAAIAKRRLGLASDPLHLWMTAA
jgi:DNA modification methylase